ncbi:MAG: helix-turn-helix transcriptional regulator [Microthrixaceae bacterium]
MDASVVLKLVRRRSGLSLRSLAQRAGTSHATLSSYEAGRVVPSVGTLDRIVTAAGFDLQVSLESRIDGPGTGDDLKCAGPGAHGDRAAGRNGPDDTEGPDSGRAARGQELVEVLELAAMFPARHTSTLEAPIFGRTRVVVSSN